MGPGINLRGFDERNCLFEKWRGGWTESGEKRPCEVRSGKRRMEYGLGKVVYRSLPLAKGYPRRNTLRCGSGGLGGDGEGDLERIKIPSA